VTSKKKNARHNQQGNRVLSELQQTKQFFFFFFFRLLSWLESIPLSPPGSREELVLPYQLRVACNWFAPGEKTFALTARSFSVCA